jgi:UDP-N-acetylglucosamine 3-dehydrogenase
VTPAETERGSALAIGVVGLRFGANHARILDGMDSVRLAAVCDPDEQRLAAAAQGREARAYADYEAMLREETLNAVVVAVPARLHEAVALAAIRSGCALLVEKPLAPSLDEGLRLANAAASAGVMLVPGHLERFNPAVQELKRRLRAGEIGRVLHLTARRMGPIVVRNQDVNVVHDTALHDVDAMRYLLGADVEHVFAEGRSDLGMPFEDSISALLRFSPLTAQVDGASVTASIEANWLAPIRIRDLTVRGTQGMFVLDYAAQTLDLYPGGPAAETPSAAGESPLRVEVEQAEPLRLELEAFVAALRRQRPLPVQPGDALAALAVCDALTQSARTGRPVIPRRVR